MVRMIKMWYCLAQSYCAKLKSAASLRAWKCICISRCATRTHLSRGLNPQHEEELLTLPAGMVLSPHLNQDELPLQGLPIRPFFPEAEVDLKWWLLLYLTFLVGNELCRR